MGKFEKISEAVTRQFIDDFNSKEGTELTLIQARKLTRRALKETGLVDQLQSREELERIVTSNFDNLVRLEQEALSLGATTEERDAVRTAITTLAGVFDFVTAPTFEQDLT